MTPLGVPTSKVATTLGVQENTVRRWCIAGEIQAIKVGKKWFVASYEYDRICDALTEAA